MDVNVFIENFKEAFGADKQLPLAFWYSDTPAGDNSKISGCIFKFLPKARSGEVVSLSGDSTTCGTYYLGFGPWRPLIPNFVSCTERYKQSPEDVLQYLETFKDNGIDHAYLNFARIDKITSFEGIEGLLCIAEPDMMSGLCSWAFFDNNDDSAVSTLFGSGCSTTVAVAVRENKLNGRRTFLSGFDPSVRPYYGPNELTFTIPLSRLKEMYHTMRNTCLFGIKAWQKVRDRA